MKLKALNIKYKILLLIIAIMLIISGVSYAYFAVTTNGSSNQNIVTSGTMKLTFTDGPEIRLDNAIPGDYLTKTFNITNTGTLTTTYDIYFSEVINEFNDQGDLVYLILSNDGGYNSTSDLQVPNTSSKIVNSYSIDPGVTQTYTLTIKFLNINENQDDNQGKIFSSKIQLNEYNNLDITTNYYLNDSKISYMPSQSSYIKYDATNSSCNNGVTLTFNQDNWSYSTSKVKMINTICNIKFTMAPINYDYTGSEQKFTIPIDGYYKLETWGAQGGYVNGYSLISGYGGYSEGILNATKDTNLYIQVGGKGSDMASSYSVLAGGYNGGGDAVGADGYTEHTGSGGGATHISLVSGLLKNLSNNQNKIIIVSGGGGGMAYYLSYAPFYHYGNGGSAGGYVGQSNYGNYGGNLPLYSATGGSQTAGGIGNTGSGFNGSFGQGRSGTSTGATGGGGGWYGGAASILQGGGGGSSYIGNSLLLSSSTLTKHMTCYNCSTSSVSSTKTITTTNVSATATVDYAKMGNGYSRITYIGSSLN